jgi:hypothetical protein
VSPLRWIKVVGSIAIQVAVGLALLAATGRAQTVDPYHSIGLQWTATGDDSTSGRATAYQLKYSTTNPGGGSLDTWWNQTATSVPGAQLPTPRTSGSTDSVRVAGLATGTTYYFVIRAVDDAGNASGYSNVASSATASCSAPTSAPSAFAADTSGTAVVLSWNGPADPLATSLKLYRGVGSSGALSLYQTLSPGQNGYTDTAVSSGTTYRYRAAYAVACSDGPSSATISVTTPGPPPPPPGTSAGLATVHAYPNPSTAGSPLSLVIQIEGTASQAVHLRLFDMNGRWVADIADRDFSPGSNTITWSRIGRNGNPVAPGYYEILGTAGGTKLRERILLLP